VRFYSHLGFKARSLLGTHAYLGTAATALRAEVRRGVNAGPVIVAGRSSGEAQRQDVTNSTGAPNASFQGITFVSARAGLGDAICPPVWLQPKSCKSVRLKCKDSLK
jgi:hypothetical protein